MRQLAATAFVVVAIAALTAQAPKTKSGRRVGTSGRANDATTLINLEKEWTGLVQRKDMARLRELYDDNLTDIGPDGKIQGKQQDLEDIRNGDFTIESEQISDILPRIFGDTAVVTGVSNLKGSYKGQAFSGRYRWTDTFVRRNDGWRLVATQVTKMAED